jgi:hypothetical protein
MWMQNSNNCGGTLYPPIHHQQRHALRSALYPLHSTYYYYSVLVTLLPISTENCVLSPSMQDVAAKHHPKYVVLSAS